jgi:hypothetical protein
MATPLGVTYKLNVDDIQAAQWHCLRTSPSMRRNYRIASVLVLLLTLTALALISAALDAEWWVVGVLTVPVVAFWVFQFPRSYRQGLERNTRKMLREGRNALLQCNFRMEIDERGLSVKSEMGESRLSWDAVERVDETDAHIFIYVGSLTGHTVPKWAFESNGRAREFFEAASEFQRRAEFS